MSETGRPATDLVAAPPYSGRGSGKILITGAAGFIGSNLAEALLARGRELILIDDFNDFYDPAFKRANLAEVMRAAARPGLKAPVTAEMNAGDPAALDRLFAAHPIEGVIHLAASAGVRPSIADPARYAQNNLVVTAALLEAMARHKAERLIFASSSSVYGGNLKIPFSESDPADQPLSPYAATKRAGELLCRSFAHLHGLKIACLRFFTVYGPRQRPDLAIYKFTDLLFQGRPLPFHGDGQTRRDYTYIDDITGGIAAAWRWLEGLDGPACEIFNLGESRTVTLEEMVRTLEKITGRRAVLERRPPAAGDVHSTFADIAKARRVLGYEPRTGFGEGLTAFVDWFRRNRPPLATKAR